MLGELSLYGVVVHSGDVTLHLRLAILSFLKRHISPLYHIVFVLFLVKLFLETRLNHP